MAQRLEGGKGGSRGFIDHRLACPKSNPQAPSVTSVSEEPCEGYLALGWSFGTKAEGIQKVPEGL